MHLTTNYMTLYMDMTAMTKFAAKKLRIS